MKTNNILTDYKCFQYADDVNLFLQDEFQVDKALTIIDDFSSRAGAKLNILKTEGILLGNLKSKADSMSTTTIKWTQNPAGCLGIYIGNDKFKCDYLNWS